MTGERPHASTVEAARDPIAVLRRAAFLLERSGESAAAAGGGGITELYRARAFRTAAATLERVGRTELEERARAGTLEALPGLGKVTAALVREVLAGEEPRYLLQLEERVASRPPSPGTVLLEALRGDCHAHSNWSDGVASIREMAEGAIALGHDYMALTDHSPSLRIARGLDAARLLDQLEVVADLNRELAPFRILTGIEVDILVDGSLDQEEELLARLDVVVGSVHSLLRMPGEPMTERLLRAVANPHLDILGHCTGRMRTRRRDRPESEFDAAGVFSMCARLDKAVEVNSLPARRDPPSRLIQEALGLGCRFAIDSDAHSPGQLDGKVAGCERAAANGVTVDRVINAMDVDGLLAWTRSHEASSGREGRS